MDSLNSSEFELIICCNNDVGNSKISPWYAIKKQISELVCKPSFFGNDKLNKLIIVFIFIIITITTKAGNN
jgi:hypothetical protein